jgi:hypothetical protein
MKWDQMKTEVTAVDIIGAWQLQSWLIHYQDGREPGTPFGSHPSGLLLYSPDGWMSATVHRSKREPLATDRSPRDVSPELVAQAYWSYFHYAGPWRIEGDKVIHSVRYSLNPAMVGTEQVRQMQLAGHKLTLSGIEAIREDSRRHELVWRRAES